MPRHASYVPHGVIPAVLLPFDNDFAIDEASFRKHLRDVAAVEGLSAITINAHSTEVASCTFDEQRRVLEIAQDEVGTRLPLINGVWADGSMEAARIARMAAQGGASALLVFPPAPFTLGQSPAMTLAHFRRIADATDLPLIVFQYPLSTGQGYPKETLLKLCDEIPSIRAIKDWIDNVPHHDWHIRTLQNLARPVNVLTTHSSWLFSSLVLGCNGLLSQCFPQLMKQPCILDCDNSLSGKILNNFDLFIGERPDLLATDYERTHQFTVLQQRHSEHRSDTANFHGRNSRRVSFNVSLISS